MERFPSRLLKLSFLFCAIHGGTQASEKEIVLSEEIQLELADAFMQESEYYRSITEYKKFLILFPDSDKSDYASFKIGMAQYRGEEYQSSARTFALTRNRYRESKYASASGYYEGLSYWRLNSLDKAATTFDAVVALGPASEYAPRALIAKSLVRFDEGNLLACRQELERFLADYSREDRAGHVEETVSLIDRHRELPRKSPALAGTLSAVMPGSGQVYAEHYGDGVTSFIVNGLFIAGTIVAIRQENYPVAAIVGGVGLPFYIGNIYGAANAATKWNVGIKKTLRGEIAAALDVEY